MSPLRIGTRGSVLARTQAEHVKALLSERCPEVGVAEIVVVRVSGDGDGNGDLTRSGRPEGMPAAAHTTSAVAPDKSRWVDRIEEALIAGEVNLAVHSAKDVPGALAAGLQLLGAPARGAAEDVLCGAGDLDALAPGARIGTSSVRRAAQLRAVREDLEIVALGGNVDTRLQILARGEARRDRAGARGP